MHEMAYTWQNQGPVSINSCLTIEYLLKECITEEVPCVSLLRTVIMSGGNSRELNLWCPTLVLLSQTCFLLLLSGSYGYDRSCWFQAKMIINIRNELPSSCLGSLHQNDLCPWMIECTKWHIHDKIKDQFPINICRLLSIY